MMIIFSGAVLLAFASIFSIGLSVPASFAFGIAALCCIGIHEYLSRSRD